MTITRAHFDELTRTLVARLWEPMVNALADAKMSKPDIHDIILVGGATRMVRVQEVVKEFFDGKEQVKKINQDEVVAFGAGNSTSIFSRYNLSCQRLYCLFECPNFII